VLKCVFNRTRNRDRTEESRGRVTPRSRRTRRRRASARLDVAPRPRSRPRPHRGNRRGVRGRPWSHRNVVLAGSPRPCAQIRGVKINTALSRRACVCCARENVNLSGGGGVTRRSLSSSSSSSAAATRRDLELRL